MLVIAAACGVLGCAGAAAADTINPGETKSATVLGQASVYQIFGHPGNTGGDYGPAQDAVLFQFASGAGNVFSFAAGGEIGCCSSLVPGWGPDGAAGGTNVGGINGLSSLSGNALIPLVGVFTTDVDPFGGAAPSALAFDAAAGSALSPLLQQVFYIGDGRSGFNNGAGSILQFTAPTGATRLYLGTLDAFSFNGTAGYYNDNPGEFQVRVSLAGGGLVPEPSTWALMIAGFGLAGSALRRRRWAAA
jgi:hypothetical protein